MLPKVFLPSVLFFGAFFFSFIGCEQEKPEQKTTKLVGKSCFSCPKISPEQDTLDFVRSIRRFVASNVDIGNLRTSYCDTFYRVSVEDFPTESYLDLFRKDESTGSCGLAAMIMTRILLDNGILAYTYNFGFDGTRLTHVITLVKLHGDLLIFDPYMNYELVDKKGHNIGLFRLLDSLNYTTSFCKPSYDTVAGEFLLNHSALSEDKFTLSEQEPFKSFLLKHENLNDSVIKVRYDKCFECSTDPLSTLFIEEMLTVLSKQKNNPVLEDLFALKINNIYGASDYEEVNRKVDSLLLELKTDLN